MDYFAMDMVVMNLQFWFLWTNEKESDFPYVIAYSLVILAIWYRTSVPNLALSKVLVKFCYFKKKMSWAFDSCEYRGIYHTLFRCIIWFRLEVVSWASLSCANRQDNHVIQWKYRFRDQLWNTEPLIEICYNVAICYWAMLFHRSR